MKKAKLRNKILVCGGVIVAAAIVAFVVYDTRSFQTTSSARLDDKYGAPVERVRSSVDADGDGINDQEDILQGALDYVATNPKYKSRYYAETGYPNDQFGVCTDVAANALRSAGYDLKQMLQDDISAHPERYDIDEPDPSIDFRRVWNLRPFFEHNAIGLTTDLTDVEQWQGGDIALFENHIGVVSDRRNERGVPYLIHSNDPFQPTYEEDVLESRDDLVAHYRMSE